MIENVVNGLQQIKMECKTPEQLIYNICRTLKQFEAQFKQGKERQNFLELVNELSGSCVVFKDMALDYVGAHVAKELGWEPQTDLGAIPLKKGTVDKQEFDRHLTTFQELSDLLLKVQEKEESRNLVDQIVLKIDSLALRSEAGMSILLESYREESPVLMQVIFRVA